MLHRHIARRLGYLLLPVALTPFFLVSPARSEGLPLEYACSRSYDMPVYFVEYDNSYSAYIAWLFLGIPDDCYRKGYIHLLDVRLACSDTFVVHLAQDLTVTCSSRSRRRFGDFVGFHVYSTRMDTYVDLTSAVSGESWVIVEMDVYRVLTAYDGAWTPTAVASPYPTLTPTVVPSPTLVADVACQQTYLDGVLDLSDDKYIGHLLIAYEGVQLIKRNEYVRKVLGDELRFIAGVDYDYAVADGARLDVCDKRDVEALSVSVAQDSYMLLSFFGIAVVGLLSVLVLRR